MKTLATGLVLIGVLGAQASAQAVVATFDDLTSPPGVAGANGLFFRQWQ